MKKRALAVLILLLCVGAVNANPKSALRATVSPPAIGTPASVSLSWTLSTSDTTANCPSSTACSQNIYRCTGATCTLSGPPLASLSATATTFTDTAVSANTDYVYGVTFVVGSSESVLSNQVTAVIPALPNPPSGLSVTSVVAFKNSDGTTTVIAQYQDAPNRTTKFQIAQLYPYKVEKSGSLVNSNGNYTVSWTGLLSGRAYLDVCDSTGKCASAYSQ